MRRLPARLPQALDTPVPTARLLYKASTGSYKAADQLRSLLELVVVAILGHRVWEDASVAEWEAQLAARLPPRPSAEALQALLDQAHADGLIERAVLLGAAPPAGASAPSRAGALDEAELLAAALTAMHADWDGPRLLACAVAQAWPPGLHVRRRELVQAALALLFLLEAVPRAQLAHHLIAQLAEDDDPQPFLAELLADNLRLLGVSPAELAPHRALLPEALRAAL
ncbi:MAG: hypothetical protein H6741_24880 [Alphaproteobacteria bacterium]|nr:hypothetical protein [Alphaproteobacteria bacterium]MCB9795943.1 hypothetical protein [Alphaproteobacteria bacterium]